MPLSRRTLLTNTAPLGLGGLLATTGCFASSASGSDRLTIAMALAPAAALSTHSEDAFLLARWSVAETLVGLDDNGRPVPKLAVDWTQTEPNAWEFTLRDDVQHHDGSPLNAFTVAIALTFATQAAAVPRAIDGIGLGADDIDDRTLRITTEAPDPVLPQRLSSPHLAILSMGGYADGAVDPVGHATGPFVITEATSTGVVLERNGDYWGEPAAMEGFRADYVPDAATRVAALRSGEAHVIEAVPYAQIASLEDSRLQDAPTGRTVSLYLNTETGPLADPALRAAVAAAIDTAPIVDDIYEGRADAPEGLFGPALAWAAEHRDYTLPAAGTPSGETLRLGTYSNRAELPEALVVLASQLEAAGFAVETDVRGYNDIEPDMLAGDFDGFLLSRSVVQDSGDAYSYLESDFTSNGGFNVSQLADGTADAAIAAIGAAAEPGWETAAAAEARQNAALDAEAVVLATAAVIPIAHERLVTGVAPGVASVTSDPLEREIITAATTMELPVALLRGTLTRLEVLLAVLVAIGLLPWLAERDPALTVLRARYPAREASETALAGIRAELGLDAGPLALLRDWLAGLARGDLGIAWASGESVAQTVLPALGVSLTVMGAAFAVTLAIAALACSPALRRAAEGRPVGAGGVAVASFAALPDFLIATLGVAVFAAWAGVLPAYGFTSPLHLLLPAVAMGLPGGGVLARLGRDVIGRVAAEDWVRQWRTAGYSRARIMRGLLRRALPPVLPQFAIIAVSITGAAVATETIFAIPGLGRTALAAADAQDLPVLQACMALLIGLGFTAGIVARLASVALEGSAAEAAAIPVTPPVSGGHRRHLAWLAATAVPLLTAIAYGAARSGDIATGSRLDGPSAAAWLGTDELGRDVLARLGQGALWTAGAAFLACGLAYAFALALGFAPRLAHPLAEAFNSFPVAIAGMLVVVVLGRGQFGAVLAVVAVAWPPLAAHAADLVAQARTAGHVEARRALGAGEWWMLRKHTLPLVAGPLAAHAGMRLPGMALGIASLGFLGLGAGADTPEWGASLARSLPYLERAPLAALAPAAAMIALTLAVMALVSTATRRR